MIGDPLFDQALEERSLEEGSKMRVNTVSAEVRFSRAINKELWNTVALGAEASLENGQSRQEAQEALYQELASHLRTIFTNGGSEKPQEPQNGPSWCPIHNCQMKAREKNGGRWYSHRVGNTWCQGGNGKKPRTAASGCRSRKATVSAPQSQ